MVFKSISYTVLLSVLICIGAGFSDTPVLDEFGEATGLINVNPDPDGEPWIAGGALELTPEEIAAIPELELPDYYNDREKSALPVKVDNSVRKYFIPLFNQKGASCCQASGVSYTFSYEMNYLRGVSGASTENQYPYGFTYNFINNGSSSTYSSYTQGWNIIQKTGIPNVSEYGGTLYGDNTQTNWVDGYNAYYNGMKNRTIDYFKISSMDAAGIAKIKQWLYDHTSRDSVGGVVNFLTNVSGLQKTTLPSGSPEAGHTVITKFGTSGGHCMTIVGYHDSIRLDMNNDGQFTADRDVNNDGAVDIRDREYGGFLMVNSYGTTWGTGGKAYIMYSVCGLSSGGIGGSVYGIHVKESKAALTVKTTITHGTRNLLKVYAGMSNTLTATQPTTTATFSSAFNYAGGANPMKGSGASSTIQIGLDVTSLADQMTGTKAKFFLCVESKGGTGDIDSFSLVEYTGTGEKEIKHPDKNVTIKPGTSSSTALTTMEIIYEKSPTGIDKSTKQIHAQDLNRIKVLRSSKELKILLPLNDPCLVTLTDVQGRKITSFNTIKGKEWYQVPSSISSGVLILTVNSGGKQFAKKLELLK